MIKRAAIVVGITLLVLVAAAVRLNNALVYPPLRSYDGFAHFTYIWFMAENWRVPLPTSGWEFFQPPLYYALMAWVWNTLASVDPVQRLRIGVALVGVLGLTHAWVGYVIVRRYLHGARLAAWMAAGLMLFIPVHLYSAGFLGNENLNAVLCSWSLLALLRVLGKPTWRAAVLLGSLLGLAMLTKFTALAMVVSAFGTLVLRILVRGKWNPDLRTVLIAGIVMVMVCGWFYGRNLTLYGTPFKMSRDEFMLQHVENQQTAGRRGLLEYLLFDPMVLRRPQWPRGLPLVGPLPRDVERSSLRESVWTGVYANTWFDGFGGWILPPVTVSEAARRSGQILLTLGLIPTGLVLLGLWTAIRRLLRRGWDDTLVAALLCFTTMVAIFVFATHSVPMHAAVKATYLLPTTVVFSLWFAIGFDRLRRARPGSTRYVLAACAVLVLVGCNAFTQGLPMTQSWLASSEEGTVWKNAYGTVYYAAGDKERARDFFDGAATDGLYLAYENLAALAHETDHPLDALYLLRIAARLQPGQSFGLPPDRARFDLETQAEYAALRSVLYYDLGWLTESLAAAQAAVSRNGAIPEARYNLAVGKLTRSLSLGSEQEGARRVLVEHAKRHLSEAIAQDGAFFEAQAMLGVAEALAGDCERAAALLAEALRPHPGSYRFYPLVTGPGDLHSAGLRRRRRIESLPEELNPNRYLEHCDATKAALAGLPPS